MRGSAIVDRTGGRAVIVGVRDCREGAAAGDGPAVSNGTANYIGTFVDKVDLVNSQLYDTGSDIGLDVTRRRARNALRRPHRGVALVPHGQTRLRPGAVGEPLVEVLERRRVLESRLAAVEAA